MATDLLLQKPPAEIRVELYGTTEFSIGSSAKPIAVDIAVGYKKRIVDLKPVKSIYAYFKASDNKDITLERLIKACGGDDSQIPDVLLKGFGFKSFSISYGSSVNSSKFRISLDTRIHLDKTDLDATITISYDKSKGQKAFTFGGILKLEGGHTFNLKFKKSDASYLFASYRHKGKTNIDLRKISAEIFGSEVAVKMPDVSFDLENFKAFILYKNQEGKSSVLFGMGAGLNLDLKDLPMAGSIISQEKSFSFEEVLVMYSKGTFTKSELADFPVIPAVEIAAGFNISTGLKINNIPNFYILNDGVDKTYTEEPDTLKPDSVESIKGETSSKAKWTKIDKKLGPVHLQRLGFLYDKGKVALLLDASVSAAGMGMQLMGLGLGFKLEWPPKTPEFYIDGLGLSYTKDPVRISGMFTRVTPKPDEVYSYYGAAQLSFSKFNISGIGAYSKLTENRGISFFVYAMYQGAIGGPSFFFVTGIAAGFGYNRTVRIPKITEVATFPLVAMALNPVPTKSLDQILAELIVNDCIPTSPGDYWLAIGIKFTTFKILESFILVIVQFGTRTEFTILGLSILAWPDKNSPIAYVELALKASFGPDSEVMSIEAMLTNNSYILDKNCKLTGGFAFYAWVSGAHEGDFVITLGGYHPKFMKPKHYPDVQRLGLNWRISKELQIKGGLYYALTPSCIMAGGRLEITYTLSFLRGSIVIWADMLIAWAPFHYAIDLGISIQIDANIDMWLFTVKFNIEMGAQLHIWGPPFAGTVFVDWSIFAFTIPFGNANAEANKDLKWPEFQTQFIPAEKKPALLKGASAGPTYLAAEIIIAAGIINEYVADDGKKYIIVNPHKLSIKVEAPMPVITAKAGADELAKGTPMLVNDVRLTYHERNQALGIRPMGIKQLASILTVNIVGVAGLVCSAYANSVPEALWSPGKSKGNNSTPDESKVLTNALKGVVLSPKEVDVPEGTPQFDLKGKFTPVYKTYAWAYVAALTGPDNAGIDAKDIIVDKLKDRDIVGQGGIRQAIILSALAAQGLGDSPEVDNDILQWVSSLGAEPVIVQAGGLPQYKPETGA